MKNYYEAPIKVLDHGYVRYISHMGSDETIIEAARMSTGRGFEGWEKDAKLLAFLYSNQHMTPFEMCELHIEVKAPIFVFREWHRHRTWSYNEMSARYTQMPNEHYLPELSRIQKQSASNKQGSGEAFGEHFSKTIVKVLHQEQENVYATYDELITQHGVAKEVARINTPVSRYSVMRAKTDLRNVLAFLALRLPANAQWEIRQYADAVVKIVRELWPRTWELFEEHTLHAVKLSRTEAASMREVLEEKTTAADLRAAAIRKRLGL